MIYLEKNQTSDQFAEKIWKRSTCQDNKRQMTWEMHHR